MNHLHEAGRSTQLCTDRFGEICHTSAESTLG